jgi:hypothetical protein
MLAASTPLAAMPAQIIVIRHAEKPKDHDEQHLSDAGRERSERLVDFVNNNKELTKYGLPIALLASRQTKDGAGQRPAETLEPLAKQLKISIQSPYQSAHAEALAHMILTSKDYEGKTIMVCWTHEHIPQLIEALGVNPPPKKLPDYIYDRVYIVRYDGTRASLLTLNQDIGSTAHPQKRRFHHK